MKPNAFTLGHTKSYNQAILENAKKLGKTENYEGGWIWKTAEQARVFLNSPAFLEVDWGDGKRRDPASFSVYGLIVDWDNDVVFNEPSGVYLLLTDSLIIPIE